MISQFQALELWRHSLVESVRGDAPDLSARQMALLLTVYLEEGPHTVRGMAKRLKISKPAVSRALDRLGELGYVRRERDEVDRRNVLIRRTIGGAEFLANFASLVIEASEHINTLPVRDADFGFWGEKYKTPETSLRETENSWAEAAA